mgnify:CR=1 FL=1
MTELNIIELVKAMAVSGGAGGVSAMAFYLHNRWQKNGRDFRPKKFLRLVLLGTFIGFLTPAIDKYYPFLEELGFSSKDSVINLAEGFGAGYIAVIVNAIIKGLKDR